MKAFFSWIRQWARDAAASVTDLNFWRPAEGRRPAVAVGHLAMLAVLWTLPVTVLFFLGLRQVAGSVSGILRSDIPAGTVFEMKDGRLTNTLVEPLVFREEGSVVIVNTASSTLALAEGEEGMVVDAEGVITQDASGQETVSFRGAPDFKVDREGMLAQVTRWAPLALFLGSLVTLVFLFLLTWVGLLLGALLHGLILWLLFKAIRRPRAWRASFAIAAYAATLPTLIRVFVQGFEPLAFVPGLAYWLIVAWVAYAAWQDAPSASGGHDGKEEGNAGKPGPRQDGPDAAA